MSAPRGGVRARLGPLPAPQPCPSGRRPLLSSPLPLGGAAAADAASCGPLSPCPLSGPATAPAASHRGGCHPASGRGPLQGGHNACHTIPEMSWKQMCSFHTNLPSACPAPGAVLGQRSFPPGTSIPGDRGQRTRDWVGTSGLSQRRLREKRGRGAPRGWGRWRLIQAALRKIPPAGTRVS